MRIRDQYDVIVSGGGTAGAVAAIGAARAGAKTLLVERYGSLGGILSLGMAFLGTSDAEGYQALGGVGAELMSRIDALGMGGAPRTQLDPFFGSVQGQDPELIQAVILEMTQEAGVQLLFHSWVTDVVMDGERVQGVVVVNKAGTEIITGKTFVDCTGDADIVARAGGDFTFGREEDGLTQPVSRIFRVGNVDIEKVWDYLDENPDEMRIPEGWTGESFSKGHLRQTPGATVEGFGTLIEKARAAGDYTIPRDRLGIYTLPGRREVGINITRVHDVDGTNPDDLTRAEVESQLQMLEAVQFLRKYVPGFENTYLISSPFQVGVRESRHIQGDYTLTKDDVLEGRDFDDQVGRGAYPLDIHDVQPAAEVLGREVQGGGVTLWKLDRSYGIPLRTLIANGVDNITVGGRCISATHEAAGSIRGQAVCMASGHAAGVAAAVAAREGCALKQLDAGTVQEAMKAQDAILERNVKLE